MRILIDECIDERFRNSLPGHDCQTARYAGLAGLKNGDLLAAAATGKFDIFLAGDQGIEYQQNLTARKIAIIIFRARSNRLKDLLPLAPLASRASHRFNRGRSLGSRIKWIFPLVFGIRKRIRIARNTIYSRSGGVTLAIQES